MHTRVCDLLGIEYPILAFSHCRDVVAAVTNAGGFGVLGATAMTPEGLDAELTWIEEQVRGRPYGVDILFPAEYVGQDGDLGISDLAGMIPDEHRRFVDDLLVRYDVPPLADTAADGIGDGVGTALTLNPDRLAELTEVTFAHPIRLVANALGPPPPALVEQAHAQDVPVASLAGTVVHAERNAALGVDVVVAQGTEAGGHTGDIATMVLVPEVVDAVAPVPVLAAGGIARGRQIAASLALGAQGVWTGSVWLTTEEAETHPVVREKLLAASSTDTVRSRSITGKPARQLRSAWTDEWEGETSPGALPMPLQPLLVDEARQRIDRAAHQPGSGASELANYFVGQVVGSLDRVRPARRVVQEMVAELAETMSELAVETAGLEEAGSAP
jgi:NAD(P)H-dependent flavin oxidoreductase YrpB (nitropropane dioxygenase family)